MFVEELEKLRDDIAPLELDPLRAAIRGQEVPEDFLHDLTYKCVVAGIRYHDGFAAELRGKSLHQSLERAFNARDIMSNRIPKMEKPEDIPACAVGGYTELYKELDLLPDVAMAEEARDNLPQSKDIYDLLMDEPSLYRVMDDYNICLLDKPQPGAFLNGDTCVRSTLDKREPIHHELFPPPFDITEDWRLSAGGERLEDLPIPKDTLALLYAPLPRHLPTVDKDILILMAAFTGNIDRYSRLRRQRAINGEMQCVVRGIYHDTLFAKWCYQQPELAMLRKFVHARFIMNDDLGWLDNIESPSKDDVPHIIWYPRTAHPTTYMELLRSIPELKQLIAQALVVSNSPYNFVGLEPEITPEIYTEIHGAHTDLFHEYVDQRVSEEEKEELGEWMELPHDIHDVAPYDHLVSKEMKAPFTQLLEMATLADVGFGNREDWGRAFKDAGGFMRYMSAFPKRPRDPFQERRDEEHRMRVARRREISEGETPSRGP
ncbi:hypothetical protein ACLX1H_009253 [Fusarium chlamydosporum]